VHDNATARHVHFESDQNKCYEVKDVMRFYWIVGSDEIYVVFDKEGNSDLLIFWFMHQLLPFYLSYEKKFDFFHAGAVEVEGKNILFIAPSMGGKSTTTDYFIQQGHPLVSDDKVATFIDNGKPIAVGSHSYHRPYRAFEDLGYYVTNFTNTFKPIHAFYVLKQAKATDNITIEALHGFKKYDALLGNDMYIFSWEKPDRLKSQATLATKLNVFSIQVPWDKNRLNEVYDAIIQHSKEIL